MAAPNRIVELSRLITKEIAKLNEFLVENSLPTPSLEADALWSLPIPEAATDLEASRMAVISACSELKALMTGPEGALILQSKPTKPHVMWKSLVVELDEFWPAGVKMADAMETWPNSDENNGTGFSLANNTNKSMFDFFADHHDRGEQNQRGRC
ncbi:hypothetical protein HD806DRAFT_534920 [Xylariaceae sp. AK1471]|nr:hypothetical protein HD806DRAFT_534920 [Xylariaceae sp. AK1471]